MRTAEQSSIHIGEILCVGTELLLGQITNTNASWLARQLTLLGISSYYQTVVGDNPDRMRQAMRVAADRSDLIVITGGLGPTADDLTMAIAAEVAGQPLIEHAPSRAAIADFFQRLNRTNITENNWKQAMMPRDGLIMPNNNGTAPGAIIEFEFNGRPKVMILLPGPPSEMTLMFQEAAAPYLEKRTSTRFRHHFVRLIGIGESAAETQLKDLIDRQENPTLAPYASEGEVMFRVTQLVHSDAELDNTAELIEEIKSRMGEYIYEIGTRSMPAVVKDLLNERHLTISFAESCTAGLVSSTFGELPGVSNVFKGALVAYDNDVKINQLHVDSASLEQFGAVSEAVASAMATGCRDVFKTDYAVAVTGIAGPEGGTPEKPVGLVYLAVAYEGGFSVRKIQIPGNRARVRNVSALNAFDLVRKTLLAREDGQHQS
ncbi:MAG: competence/damage-inducible protein A [Eubacteriales bacterium]|nr:competence/damage-inducible protein A [Eubacteriales bacterium]